MKFLTTNLVAGQYFNGVLLTAPDVFYVAIDSVDTVRMLRSAMTPTDEAQVLEIVQNVHKFTIAQEHNKNLTTVFEYPVSSGSTFSINNQDIQNYNALQLYKNSFAYPYTYFGNHGAKVVFNNISDLDVFHAAAFVKYNSVEAARYKPAISAIDNVTITTSLEDAIADVFAISY